MKPLIKHTKSFPVTIYIAGRYSKAVKICKKYCDDTGFCVTVTQTQYVHTSGQEHGVIVGLINYPRFPSDPTTMVSRATDIAELLRVGLDQESYSIQTPDDTIWYSYRKGDVTND
jgi:hypothetical protein